MKVINQLYFDILRLARRRVLAAAIILVPVVAAFVRSAMEASSASHPGSWSFSLVFLAIAAGSAGWLHVHDVISGLAQVICSTPARSSTLIWSRIAVGVVLLVFQLAIHRFALTAGGWF